jgi:hypothetical protein
VEADRRLADPYFDLLQASSKQLVLFEDSGYAMIWKELSKFYELMVCTVLYATY